MAGSTISGTITTTVTLGSASYPSPLTVIGTGDITVSAYAATGIYGPAGGGTLLNDGTVTGGAGSAGSLGGGGGTGVYLLSGSTATNDGTVIGGAGGTGVYLGGNGGVGVYLAAGAGFTNKATITGGGGGHGTGSGATQGIGGIGVLLNGGTLANSDDIAGGNGFGGRGYGGSGAILLAGTLTNTGTITGGSGDIGGGSGSRFFAQDGNGVYLSATATLVNNGTVIGGHGLFFGGSGIFLAAAGTLTITGVVTGGGASQDGGNGVYLAGGGSVDNTGTITGGAGVFGGSGVKLANGGSLTNAATITGGTGDNSSGGNGGSGVTLAKGGVLINTALIAGGVGGANASGNGGSGGDGVDLATGGTLTNNANATITGGAGGYGLSNGGNGGTGASLTGGTLTNAGTITGGNGAGTGPDSFGGYGGNGVSLTAGALLTNTGSIGAGFAGYGFFGATGGTGVALASSSLANTFINSGTVTGGSGAKVAPGGAATLLAYIYGGNGASVAAGDTLTNTGTIAAGAGVYVAAGGAFTDNGNVTGGAGVAVAGGGTLVNTGTIISGVGVYLANGGTLTTAGTISGGAYGGAAADAVLFAAAGTLVVDPGASFVGKVVANASAVDALDLASGSSTGTLSGIGTQYVDFTQITIGARASWSLTGANTIAAGATLTELGSASLSDTGTLVNDGAIMLDPSTLIAGGLIGTGAVTIGAGSTLEVQGTVAGGETLRFAGSGAYLHLDNPDSVGASSGGGVTNFAAGETIDLKGIAPASVSYSGGLLSFSGGSFALSLAGAGAVIASTSGDGAAISVLCFCANTLILTPSGERPVQDLAVGDVVTTWRGAQRPIVWIGIGKVLATRGRRNAATPVIVRKGALAGNMPHHDLRVTKGHALYLDGVLIPVEYLVNHRSIEWDDRAQEVELYHIELEAHDVLVANGAPAESYRDDGNRWLFRNANVGWGRPQLEPCAPVLTGGAAVDAVWWRLLDRAGPRPGVPVTDDPDLHLFVDGQRRDVTERVGEAYVCHLPAVPSVLRIVSRAAAPAELGQARDPRVLGVALRRLVVRKGTRFSVTEANDDRLADGFHAFEADNGFCWTDGDAAIPTELFANFTGPLELVLHIGATARYPAGNQERLSPSP
jgi:hypothetical protein